MRFWARLRFLQIRLAFFIAIEAVLTTPLFFWMFYLCLWAGVMSLWIGAGDMPGVLLILLAILIGAFCFRLLSPDPSSKEDDPLRDALSEHPELDRVVRGVAADFKKPIPPDVIFTVSPVPWQPYGANATRRRDWYGEIVLPVSCLAIWSRFDLRCEIARALVRRRDARWLAAVGEKALAKIGPRRLSRNWYSQMMNGFIRKYMRMLNTWYVLLDIDADTALANVYGGANVSRWITRASLAESVIPEFIQNVVAPAAKSGVVLPIAEASKAHHAGLEQRWLDNLHAASVQLERGGDDSSMNPLVFRLAILEHRRQAESVFDPRAAAASLSELPMIEERVLRHEMGDSIPGAVRHSELSDLATEVLLPQMKDEVERNRPALEGRSLADVPGLIRRQDELAAIYRCAPQLLLGEPQRKAMIPQLILSFLTIELINRGWSPSYSGDAGFEVELDGRTISPGNVVARLASGELSEEDYLAMIRARPASE